MEVLREVDFGFGHKWNGGGFNPCFNGSVERGDFALNHLVLILWFQSLF